MLFSVIIPVYNGETTLLNTVNSILNAGLFDYEIILVNDGSTDGTMSVCNILEKKYKCIKCVHQKNTGVSAARNRGIESASGEYLLFIDADDTLEKGTLKCAAEIVQDKKPDMLTFGISFDYYYNKRMYRREELFYPIECLWNVEQWSAEFVSLYKYNILSTVCNKFICHDLVKKEKLRFREDVFEMEDFLFVIQYMQKCTTIYLMPVTIYHYKQTENEKSTFNRLCRIDSLSNYMKLFEVELSKLEKSVRKQGKHLKDWRLVLEQIYNVLFHEQLRYSSYSAITKLAKDMLEGEFSEVIKLNNPVLFQLLSEKKYFRVYFNRVLLHFRHRVAIKLKYIKSYRRK